MAYDLHVRDFHRIRRLFAIAAALASLPLIATSAHAATVSVVQGFGSAGTRTTLQITIDNHDERVTVSYHEMHYVITNGTSTDRILRTDTSGSPPDGRTSPTLTALTFDRNAKTGVEVVLDGTVEPLLFDTRIDVTSPDFESIELRGTVGTPQTGDSFDERITIYSPMILGSNTRIQSDALHQVGSLNGAYALELSMKSLLSISSSIGTQTPLTSINAAVDYSIVIYGDAARIETTGPQTYSGSSLRFAGASTTFAASRVAFDTPRLACSNQVLACSASGRTLTLNVSEARVDGGTTGSIITAPIGDPDETSVDPTSTNTNSFKLVKAGAGTLTLTQRSYHLGATEVTDGTLRVTHANALSTTTTGTTITSGATLELAGVALAAEPLTLNGTGVSSVGALVGTGTSSTGSPIDLATTSYIGTASGGMLTLTGALSGSHLIKSGTGRLQLNAANTHASTSVGWGTLVADNANALGDTAGVILVDAGAELEIASGVTIATGAGGLFLGSTGISSPAVLNLPAGGTFSRDVTLGGAARIQNAAGTVQLTRGLDGAGRALALAGSIVTAALRDLGSLDITAGSTITTAGGISSGGTVAIDGTLAFAPTGSPPYTTTLAAARLGGAGTIRCGLANCGTVVLDVSDPSGAVAFSGVIGRVPSDASSTYAYLTLRKAGAGTLVLSGVSLIAENTIIAAGELRMTSTGAIGGGLRAGTVTVEAGARLSGGGAVGGGDYAGGVGQSVAGTVDLDGPSGPEAMTTARFDLVGGTLEVGVDGAGTHSQLQVANGVGLIANPLLRVRAGSAIPDGTTVVIVSKTHADPVEGTFAGLAEGATVTPTSGPGSFRITYTGGDGNDIALTWVAPPPTPPAASTDTGSGVGRPAGTPATTTLAVRATTPRRVGNALVSTVTVNGPGRIVQIGTLARGRAGAWACRATRTVRAAGTYRLACSLSPKARAAATRGGLRVTVVTTFTPTSGAPVMTRTTVRLARGR